MNILFLVLAIIIILVVVNKINNRGIAQVSVDYAKNMVKNTTVTVLDVRTPQEFTQGHIKGARLIPVSELSGRISEITSLKNGQMLVYCHSGNRSASAGQILRKNGFTKISNLKGGISAWNNAGNKTVKGN